MQFHLHCEGPLVQLDSSQCHSLKHLLYSSRESLTASGQQVSAAKEGG